MSIRNILQQSIADAMADLGAELLPGSIHLERPLRIEHGDWSSNIALASAKHLRKSPREVAQCVCESIAQRGVEHLESVEVAGPGFVNFHLDTGWLHDVLLEVIAKGEDGYGRLDLGHGEKVNLEFVSANPTGPIHVGNGWWGAYGDSLARVMERCGYSVHREYYVNDTGRQVQLLGERPAAPGRTLEGSPCITSTSSPKMNALAISRSGDGSNDTVLLAAAASTAGKRSPATALYSSA